MKIDFKNMTQKQRVGVIAIIAGCVALFFLLCLMIYLWILSSELPSTSELKHYQYKRPTLIFDRNGQEIAELGDERRYPVAMEQIPANMRNAVVAVEDSRFYQHGGVDMTGIIRAMVTNVRAGRVVEGGSTLTQQLVKILYLTPERKFKRKIKEAILAYRIDKALTKDQILTMYLNQVYFGRGSYGVQAAAMSYFGKDVSELTLGECAMIAGIPKAPGIYAPHLGLKRSMKRRNHVLYRMLETGYINQAQYKAATHEVPYIVETIPPKNNMAGYFVDYVKKYLTDIEGIKDLDNSGLMIYTTLDLKMQKKAEDSVKRNLLAIGKNMGYTGPVTKYTAESGDLTKQLKMDKKYLGELGFVKALVTDVARDRVNITTLEGDGHISIEDSHWASPMNGRRYSLRNFNDILTVNDIIYVKRDSGRYFLVQDPPVESAVLSVDPGTGGIYTMVGGFDYQRSMFNRAYQAKRQAGSLFKPIVYSAALEGGMNIMTQELDAPMVKTISEDGEVWKPENASKQFYGYTTLKDGLTHSRNLVTLKLAEDIGIGKILDMAQKFGLQEKFPRELAVSIGSGSVSLQEMVYAFSVFPNLGSRYQPYFVTKLVNPDGSIFKEYKPSDPTPVIKESTAQIMIDTMINVVDNGTARRALVIPRTIGGKTGTTNKSKDTWFVGYMPDLVTGVWVGCDDFRPLPGGSSGSNVALPLWIDYTGQIYYNFGHKEFPVSKDVTYYRVDSGTKQITDGFSDGYTFEPFDKPMSDSE